MVPSMGSSSFVHPGRIHFRPLSPFGAPMAAVWAISPTPAHRVAVVRNKSAYVRNLSAIVDRLNTVAGTVLSPSSLGRTAIQPQRFAGS